ncbi:MAG: type II toxin-antitoxin system RelE/ParE family toxin [Patescibacteria group bacterium]
MGLKIEFTQSALKDLGKLSSEGKQRIVKKLFELSALDHPLMFVKRLTNHSLGDFRFRIGNDRAIVRTAGQSIIVTKVGHRKDIYD